MAQSKSASVARKLIYADRLLRFNLIIEAYLFWSLILPTFIRLPGVGTHLQDRMIEEASQPIPESQGVVAGFGQSTSLAESGYEAASIWLLIDSRIGRALCCRGRSRSVTLDSALGPHREHSVVCVILDQAVDLPRWHPNFPQREREIFRRNVDKFDLASDRSSNSSNRVRDFPVRYGCRSCNRIRLADVAWAASARPQGAMQCHGCRRADACVGNRREEPPLIRDHRLECEEALKKEVWPKGTYSQVRAQGCVVLPRRYGTEGNERENLLWRQVCDNFTRCLTRAEAADSREPDLLRLGIDGGWRHEVCAVDTVQSGSNGSSWPRNGAPIGWPLLAFQSRSSCRHFRRDDARAVGVKGHSQHLRRRVLPIEGCMARPQANMSGRKFTKEISVSEGKSPEMFESPFHRNIRDPQVATTGIGEVFSRALQANGAKVVHGRHAVEFDESEVESPAGGANGSAQIGDRNGVTATCPKIFLRFARDFLTKTHALSPRAIEDRTEEGVKHCVFHLPAPTRGNSRE